MDVLLNNCKNAQKELLKLSNNDRNIMLERISKALLDNLDIIIKANKIDLDNAIKNGMSK